MEWIALLSRTLGYELRRDEPQTPREFGMPRKKVLMRTIYPEVSAGDSRSRGLQYKTTCPKKTPPVGE